MMSRHIVSPPRIIGGEYRGRKLFCPDGFDIRPTTDRVKEALFNIIQTKTKDSVFLDLFAGIGSIGFEALSRGAKQVTFVDDNKLSIQSVKNSVDMLGCRDRAQVLEMDYMNALRSLKKRFDIIYLDPPYESGLYRPAVDKILNNNLLNESGIIIAEHDSSFDAAGLNVYDDRKYGSIFLTFINGGAL